MAVKPNITGGDKLNGDWYLSPDLAEAVKNGDGIVINLRNAHREMREGYQRIITALATRDPSKTEEAHIVSVHDEAKGWINKIADRNTRLGEGVKNDLAKIKEAIDFVSALSETSHAPEIRRHYLSLSESEAFSALIKAVDRNDRVTLAAIFNAPSYLSNLTDAQVKIARDKFTENWAPDQIKRFAAIEKAYEINKDTFTDALTSVSDLFPDEKIKSIKDRIAVARAVHSGING